ncbi:uncharacterized protein LOC129592221 [Paramacrobiotus metropolitanus]|uniref:uncharacterized protein LOC129592221 n=1 Tax=Paramacrobiotus metropolitanus TaxID=2943436 RepID=UPI0024459319|nr:uncharacterized protein LOC129592221 [Paramacrobiotus metropolitanus]
MESAAPQTTSAATALISPSPALSARKEKRRQWWASSLEKRLNPAETTADSVGPSPTNVTNPPAPDIPHSDDKRKDREKRRREIIDRQRQKETAENGQNGEDEASRRRQDKKFIVFVGQIPFDTKEEEVKRRFEEIAKPEKIKNFRWATHPTSKRFKGFAYVEFSNKGAYRRAFELHNTVINGRPINVEATNPGGRKSRFRKDKLKSLSTSFQQKAKEALERKERDAAKCRKPKPPLNESTEETKVTAETEEKSTAVDEKTHPDEINQKKSSKKNSERRKRPETEEVESGGAEKASPFVRLPKKPKTGETPVDFQNSHPGSNEKPPEVKNEPTPDFKKGKNAPKNFPPRGSFGAMNQRHSETAKAFPKVSGVKPREAHLAGLGKPKVHIKFE